MMFSVYEYRSKIFTNQPEVLFSSLEDLKSVVSEWDINQEYLIQKFQEQVDDDRLYDYQAFVEYHASDIRLSDLRWQVKSFHSRSGAEFKDVNLQYRISFLHKEWVEDKYLGDFYQSGYYHGISYRSQTLYLQLKIDLEVSVLGKKQKSIEVNGKKFVSQDLEEVVLLDWTPISFYRVEQEEFLSDDKVPYQYSCSTVEYRFEL